MQLADLKRPRFYISISLIVVLAVSPGKFGIAAISPPLDAAGNSVRAQKAIADISNALCGNPYEPVVDGVCAVEK